jgi:murein DD-endopeptidase MepM/ murein hydrolase activator NlpD
LGWISAKYGIAISYIISTNNLVNPDLLSIGQVLTIPAPRLRSPGPNFKILPDYELVYGPSSALFNMSELAENWEGVFVSYTEEVEGRVLSAIEIVELVSQRYSINPRLLIALLEFRGAWMTEAVIPPQDLLYPLGYAVGGWEGLFNQLSWAADSLNAGFYLWRSGWLGPYSFGDGSVVIPGPGVNAGTVAVQHFFSQIYPVERWREVVGESGFFDVWVRLFGNPFDLAVEPLLPPDIRQPVMQLPFEEGKSWSFTSGPHSVWDNMAGWAALDFAPPGDAFGCVTSNEWVVAAADGLVTRADQGEVVIDLDQDGFEQTGWVLFYMHIEERDRVQVGTFLHAGERVGHPSCEGGVTTGTHLHLARKYNGEWIPADGSVPFEMDGWISSGFGSEYDGVLTKGNSTVEACSCRNEWNQISR